MRKFNPFRTKTHESSHRTRTSTTLRNNSKSYTSGNTDSSIPTQAFYISSPIINSSDNDVINDKDQLNENLNEEQTAFIENGNIERQISILEEPEEMSDEYNHTDDQPVSSLSTSSNQSSLSTKKSESTTSTMVGNNPKEDILTSCKATAMIYNDTQKKWIHCAPNGPAKIQLLFAPETQTYRIVGRQIQDHEVVLNHSISKGLKYNQATPTFHQWRDQSSVYGLNFSSKLDAQEFGTTMMKILESVNGSTNLSSQTNANGGATLPSSTLNNNNNNNSTASYKRQTSQPSSSLPPAATTVSINSTSTSSSSVSEPQQQQQQHLSSSYNNQLRPNSNSINSTINSTNNNYYTQRHQTAEEDETNYALISDSYSSYGDNSTNKNNNNNNPQAPPLNSSMSTTGSAPPAAPPPPPPPPPPPLPNGFGSGPPPAPALVLPTANGNGGANATRKTSTTTSAPPMDLMSEMAAKFAQRRKHIDDGEKPDSLNAANTNKATSKASAATTTLPATSAAPVQTSPRIPRKTSESHQPTNYTSSDLEKLKADILIEIRKDIEKAKQEILSAILDQHKPLRK